MAETSKRTSSSSTSKSRKSKSDIIRSKLGTYLKQNKYSVSIEFGMLVYICKWKHWNCIDCV